MQRLKLLLRCVLAYTLYYTGLLWLYANFRLRRRAVVLMYHRVLPPQADTCSSAGIIVSPSTFEMQMRFLKRHFRILALPRFQQELFDSSFGRRSCLVTFDDGWHDNLAHALPILRKHQVPATVFVATGYVGTNDTFWQERMCRLLRAAAQRGNFDTLMLQQAGIPFERTGDATLALQQARDIIATLKGRDRSAISELMVAVESGLRGTIGTSNLGEDRFLQWEDVHTLLDSGLVTIGSHAHTHLRLPPLGYQRAREELERSLQELRNHGVADVRACAYPNGDVTDPVEAAAADAGFLLGFATKGGLVAHASEALHVHRVNIHETGASTEPEFLYRILRLP